MPCADISRGRRGQSERPPKFVSLLKAQNFGLRDLNLSVELVQALPRHDPVVEAKRLQKRIEALGFEVTIAAAVVISTTAHGADFGGRFVLARSSFALG